MAKLKKRKNLLLIIGGLALLIVVTLTTSRFWFGKIPSVSNGPSSFEEGDTGLAPRETRYFAIALDYLAGKGGEVAKGVFLPDPLVTEEPKGCNVDTEGMEYLYDPATGEYIMPIENIPGAQKVPVAIVTCEFSGYPYQAEVVIDTMSDKIISWTLGQR